MRQSADNLRDDVPEPTLVEEDEVLDINYTEEVIAPTYTITSFGADFLIDGLVNRLTSNDIVVPQFDPETEGATGLPGFQRHFVWSKPQSDKFIESLLMGFPVPGIFLVQQPNNVLLVLDGQQRLATLHAYYTGILRGRHFRLTYVQDAYKGLAYADLDDEDRRRIDNSIMHATILRQDDPGDHQQAIYQIFERINSGGTPLQPHEIRIALYGGSLIRLIRDLNDEPAWRSLFGKPSPRFKDQELILRFLALYFRGASYGRPMKGFLNDFVEMERSIEGEAAELFGGLFRSTTAAIASGIGPRAFRPISPVNAAVADSVMVGVARRLAKGALGSNSALAAPYERLLGDDEYRRCVDQSTASEESVRTRLAKAEEAFCVVG